MILAALLTSATSTSRIGLQIARGELDRFKLAQAMDVGLEIAAFRASLDPQFLSSPGEELSLEIEAYSLSIKSYTPQTPLDINVSSEAQLSDFFQFLELSKEKADQLAAQIVDWRDVDDLARINGAEAQDYLHVPPSQRPQNRPFIAVDELRLVKDMSPEFFACVRPALSVTSGSAVPGAAKAIQLYGRPFKQDQRRNVRKRLGTSNKKANAGRMLGFQIEGEETMRGYPRRSEIAFARNTGDASAPYQWVSRAPVWANKTSDDPCVHFRE